MGYFLAFQHLAETGQVHPNQGHLKIIIGNWEEDVLARIANEFQLTTRLRSSAITGLRHASVFGVLRREDF